MLAGIPLLALFIVTFVNRNINCFNSLFWIDFGITYLFTFCIWYVNAKIIVWLRQRFPEFHQNKKRIISEIFLTIIATLATTFILDFIFYLIFKNEGRPMVVADNYFISLTATAFVLSVYESLFFFEKYRSALITAEELKKENLKSQLESLKHQVNPHFLFNSLNTLSSLVDEDKEASVKFIRKMAEVYRYLLQSNEKSLIALQDELNFMEAYVYMLKMRFGDSFELEMDIDASHRLMLMAPLTLQLLIENAVKHNEVSKANPLKITIQSASNNFLLIRNEIHPKQIVAKSSGMGLKNIVHRYELLGYDQVSVSIVENQFEVRIPLITHSPTS
jgi:LytS/YehU family sensor histidine kinase